MKNVCFLLMMLIPHYIFSAVLYDDTRELSSIRPVGRILLYAWYGVDTKGCTGTMIGKSCMVTAGHCKNYFHTAEFNVPASRSDGSIRHPGKTDRYRVDKKTIISINTMTSAGFDWAILRLKPNKHTGKFPGEVQGSYPVSYKLPSTFSLIRISGYGKDDLRSTHNRAQQTALGFIQGYETIFDNAPGRIFHNVDTEDGSSGSAIMLEETQEIVGINTHHECPINEEYHNLCRNGGSMISLDRSFAKAVQDCLDWEKQNL